MKRFFLLLLPLFLLTSSLAQDWIKTGTGLGVEKVRLAVPDFNASTQDPKNADLLKAFNETLWNDLDNAGIFDMVSKSFYPLGQVGTPADVKFEGWSAPPPNAAMLAFGNLGVSGNGITVQGWLYDVKNVTSPQVLGKQYQDAATNDAARATAHKFADEIIFRLGGGIAGIAESKIYFVSSRSGHKEIWAMDYDGANQHPLTSLRSISLTPRWSPDISRIAFTCFSKGGNGPVSPQICMYSVDAAKVVSFPRFKGTNSAPSWSPDGSRIVFSSSMNGNPELFSTNSGGSDLKRLTFANGASTSPAWNPKTGQSIAFVSDRSGVPKLYLMNSDGTDAQNLDLPDKGYLIDPSWAPNGQLLAFSWRRPSNNYDIYIMEVASRQIIELTHDAGRNERPSWAPDGRHIVFESTRSGTRQIWTMLADGSQARQLTTAGHNESPNWSQR
jgi:TolB protein